MTLQGKRSDGSDHPGTIRCDKAACPSYGSSATAGETLLSLGSSRSALLHDPADLGQVRIVVSEAA